MKKIKLAYVGGGSKAWARVFMYDLALCEDLSGEIALYDIDLYAADRNRRIGERLNEHPDAKSKWTYTVCEKLDDALFGADFVVLSILPATFDEMQVDVHLPEKYGVYQSVGDTVGPGGVLRAMRTVPIYEEFAREIERVCPEAWVINYTNPMSICTKTLYDVFPKIKAFGCCHEVFHAQEFLSCVAEEELNIARPKRQDIVIDASGINHFTWITKARYKGIDLLKLIPSFAEKYFETGYCEQVGKAPQDFKDDPFLYGNKVKMDLYFRYGALAAAGDRHLVEFLDGGEYLRDNKTAESWLYHLTSVDFRKAQQAERVAESELLASGQKRINLVHSDEEGVLLMRAILGMGKTVSNANMPNIGQAPDLSLGAIVETNCVFDDDTVKPVIAESLPKAVNSLVMRNLQNIETLYEGIKHRDLNEIFLSFLNQPLLSGLGKDKAYSMFKEMIVGTEGYLKEYYDI